MRNGARSRCSASLEETGREQSSVLARAALKRTRAVAISVGVLLLLGAAAFAQTELVRKPFRQWTKREAEQLLRAAPWVHTQEVRIRRAGQAQRVAGGPNPAVAQGGLLSTEQNTALLGGAQAPVDFVFTLRLRSALPVRQALVRLKQIEAKYDAMNDQEKAAFDVDPKIKGLLACPACADNYVLTLSSKSKESTGADAVYTVFKGARFDDIKRYIFIADERGARRELAHFVPPKVPGDEAIFFFPRRDEKDTPLLTPASKELFLNLTDKEINIVTNFRIDVPKLIVDGAVEF